MDTQKYGSRGLDEAKKNNNTGKVEMRVEVEFSVNVEPINTTLYFALNILQNCYQ